MEIRYFKNYSHCLGRDMEFKVYGHRGKPVLFIGFSVSAAGNYPLI